MKLGDLHKTSVNPGSQGEMGPISRVEPLVRPKPKHITRDPRLDPKEPNELVKQIGIASDTLTSIAKDIKALDLYKAQRDIVDSSHRLDDLLKPFMNNLADKLQQLQMQGWGGRTGLGNPWTEELATTTQTLNESPEDEEDPPYEAEWVEELRKRYPFVHQTIRHGRFDIQGIDIFYGENADKAGGYDKDPKTNKLIKIPLGAKPLQIKSSLFKAKEHLENWHTLPVIGWRIIPVAVGAPVGNFDEVLNQLETKGWWFNEAENMNASNKSVIGYFDRLIAAANYVIKTRKPLSDQDFKNLKFEKPPESPEYISWTKNQWKEYVQELFSKISAASAIIQDYKQQADEYMASGRGDEDIASSYISAARVQVQRVLETINYSYKGVKFLDIMKNRINSEVFSELMEKVKQLKLEVRKVKEKAVGRKQHVAKGKGKGRGKPVSSLQPHPFSSESLAITGAGTFQCDECNHASTHAIHVNPPHGSKFITIPSKKGYYCKVCGLGRTGKDSCKARQAMSEDIIKQISNLLLDTDF